MLYALIQAGEVATVYSDLPVLHPEVQIVEAADDSGVAEGWLCVDGVLSAPPAPAAAAPPSQDDLRAAAADLRWARETGGIVAGGATIATDRGSQSMIAAACALLQADETIANIDFKAESGWTSISRADMQAIGIAVGRHVQACFSAERAVDGEIAAGTLATLDAVQAAMAAALPAGGA